MAKKKTGSVAYYEALQRVFRLQSQILTRVLPHAGMRGANDEERCRTFLNSVLPRRYGLSGGFIVSSKAGSAPSREQDIVIFDDFSNSPLYREPAAGVFPVEMVYATVEVKAKLRSNDLNLTLESIRGVRRLAEECWYEFPRIDDSPGRWQLITNTSPIKRPPRSFIFAFDSEYKTATALKNALVAKLNAKSGAHIHGIVVVSKGWFFFQHVQKAGEEATVAMFEDNGLLRFVNNMLKSLKGVVVREAEMSRYLNIPTAEIDPQEAG